MVVWPKEYGSSGILSDEPKIYGQKREKFSTWKTSLLVGATGFEPATTWSQTRRATGLRYTP